MTPDALIANVEAEAALLGTYLTHRDALVRYPVAPEAFSQYAHRAIYAAIGRVAAAGETPDPMAVAAELQRSGATVSTAMLWELAEHAPPTPSRTVHEAVVEAQQRRAMQRLAEFFVAGARDMETPPLAQIEACLERLAQETRTVGASDAPMTDTLERAWLERLAAGEAQRKPRLLTGLPGIDQVVGELPRGELTVLAARPGVGKSALAAQIAGVNGESDRHVLFASAEMTATQLLERLKAAQMRVNLGRIRAGTLSTMEWQIATATRVPRFRIFDRAGMTSQHIADVMGRLSATRAVDLVIVDHLHHLSDPLERGESRYNQIGRMTNRLKALAKQHDCAVLLLCQLNREAADGSAPTMGQLRDAGTIEEYANIVMLLHRPEDQPGMVHVNIAKHRNGPTGKAMLGWYPAHQTFVDAPTTEAA